MSKSYKSSQLPQIEVRWNPDTLQPVIVMTGGTHPTEAQLITVLQNTLAFVEAREPFGKSYYKYTVHCPNCGVTTEDVTYDADPVYQDRIEECIHCGEQFYENPATVVPQVRDVEPVAIDYPEIITVVGDRLVRKGTEWVKTVDAESITRYVQNQHGVAVKSKATRSPQFTILEVIK